MSLYSFSFFFNYTATTEIYTLSLHDALPISACRYSRGYPLTARCSIRGRQSAEDRPWPWTNSTDRKSTRLNSSHANISYAVFCLKKKNIDYRIRLQLRLLRQATRSKVQPLEC